MHRLLGGRDARADPAVVTKDVSGKVHESKVEDAVKHAVTGVRDIPPVVRQRARRPVPHRTQGHSALPAEPPSPVELPPEA